MKIHLVFKDGTSHKFWQIEISGSSHTVTYGRVGTSGQSKTKTFDSAEIARKDAENLVAAKRKKGYQEQNDEVADRVSGNGQQREMKSPSHAFVDQLSMLADEDLYKPILTEIGTCVTDIRSDGGEIVFVFGDEGVLRAEEGAKADKSWPVDLQEIIRQHSRISFFPNPNNAWGLVLGDHGTAPIDELDDSCVLLEDGADKAELVSPLLDFSDWWVYDPRGKAKKPPLCCLSHEDLDVEAPISIGIGSLFLRRLAEQLKIKVPPLGKARPDQPSLRRLDDIAAVEGRSGLQSVSVLPDGDLIMAYRQIVTVSRIEGSALTNRASIPVDFSVFDSGEYGQSGWSDDESIWWFGCTRGWVAIDMNDRANPVVVSRERLELSSSQGPVVYRRGCFTLCPDDDISGFKHQPLSAGSSRTSIRLPKPVRDQFVKCAFFSAEKLVLVGQQGVTLFRQDEPSNVELIGTVKCDLSWPTALYLGSGLLAVGETSERKAKAGIIFYDISGKAPKKISSHEPNHNVVAWSNVDANLWVLFNVDDAGNPYEKADYLELKCFGYEEGFNEKASYRLDTSDNPVVMVISDSVVHLFAKEGYVIRYQLA